MLESLDFAHRMAQVSRLVTLGEMAAGLAHELNQPLSAIATYAVASERLLAASGAHLPEVREALREINAQALRAGETIRRIRQLVRPSALQPERADLNDLIGELWELVQSNARLHEVQLTFLPAATLPTAQVDALQMQQVLFNLIHNAIEAAACAQGAREVLVMTRHAESDEVEIAVCDTGPGVDAAIASRMFEPFCTTKPQGTGLGLAVSRSIVRAHGGRLDHRPNNPAGACFIIVLPAARMPE